MDNSLKKLADNLHVILHGTYDCEKIDLNDLWNLSLYNWVRHYSFSGGVGGQLPKLSKDQKKQIKDFWSPYFYFMPTKHFRSYLAQRGCIDPEFIPEDLSYMHVDRFLSDRIGAQTDDNKCLYRRFFPNTNMPKAYAYCMNGQWMDSEYNPISTSRVLGLLEGYEVVIKDATHSECGRGVRFVNISDITEETLDSLSSRISDIIIQEVIIQHPFLSSLQAKSVNCLRIYSLYWNNAIITCGAVLKVGGGKSRIDNVHSDSNGYILSIDDDGTICNQILNCHSIKTAKEDLPAAISSKIGQQIPGYKEALSLVVEAHSHVTKYGFIGWDIAIGNDGAPILVEPNFSISGIRERELCNGPLFGNLTKEILDQVFPKKKISPLLCKGARYRGEGY